MEASRGRREVEGETGRLMERLLAPGVSQLWWRFPFFFVSIVQVGAGLRRQMKRENLAEDVCTAVENEGSVSLLC